MPYKGTLTLFLDNLNGETNFSDPDSVRTFVNPVVFRLSAINISITARAVQATIGIHLI
jgi:hypothetical protein